VALLAACEEESSVSECKTGADSDAGPRQRLSQVNLYSNICNQTVASDLIEYAPAHILWSDGADKRRWLRLPSGSTIDTSNMDHWTFPIGTQVFKEFARDGKPLETRLIEKVGTNEFWMGSFVWLADGSDAVFQMDGAKDINGTQHDAPAANQCSTCHNGEPGRLLSVSAVQLSHEGPGTTLQSLAKAGLFSHPPDGDFPAPGTPVEAAALGYLHANCGSSCHNPSGTASSPIPDMNLRLSPEHRTAAETPAYLTTVGQPLTKFKQEGYTHRIAPGDPDKSALVYRMMQRGTSGQQMPPMATEFSDEVGIAALTAWIKSLPTP
jgi:hypothetical protein